MKQKNERRKLAIGLASLVLAVGLIVGVGYAYFSDIINGSGDATAGTLDITGTVGLEVNGTAAVSPIENLNPGDVITFDMSAIENEGSKSAWIRSVLEFSTLSNTNNPGTPGGPGAQTGNLADWLWVCSGGNATKTDLITSFGTTPRTLGIPDGPTITIGVTGTTCEPAATGTSFGEKVTYTTLNDVIDGTAEADSTGANGVNWTPAGAPTIFFDQLAPNAAQNGEADFAVKIQALQYRNNTTNPTNTQWNTVVTTPFGL
jgi:hypothetical protein